MAVGKAIGPGGKIARAEKKVDKAKDKVGKLVSKFSIASTDDYPTYMKKKENAAKGAAKMEKAMAKVGKAKGKVEKAVGKVADKAVKQVTKRIASDKASNMEVASYIKNPLVGPFKQAVKKRK
jgi:hypothetical protein